MGALRLQPESAAAFYKDALPLLQQHAAEIGHYPDIPLQVGYAGYLHAEKIGILRIFTARRDRALVGYAVFFVDRNGHYISSKQAKQDVFYVPPAMRGARIGLRLIRYCDFMLRAEGVQVVYHHVKLAHPQLGKLLALEGYEPIETTFGKRLDKPALGERLGGEDANARAAEPEEVA